MAAGARHLHRAGRPGADALRVRGGLERVRQPLDRQLPRRRGLRRRALLGVDDQGARPGGRPGPLRSPGRRRRGRRGRRERELLGAAAAPAVGGDGVGARRGRDEPRRLRQRDPLRRRRLAGAGRAGPGLGADGRLRPPARRCLHGRQRARPRGGAREGAGPGGRGRTLRPARERTARGAPRRRRNRRRADARGGGRGDGLRAGRAGHAGVRLPVGDPVPRPRRSRARDGARHARDVPGARRTDRALPAPQRPEAAVRPIRTHCPTRRPRPAPSRRRTPRRASTS